MLAALVLIPFIGTQRTFLALRGRARPWSRRAGLGWRYLAVPAALAGGDRDPGRDREGDGGRATVLFEERDRGSSTSAWSRRRTATAALELNEGQAVHSLYRPGSYLTDDVLGRLPGPALRRAHRAARADRDPRQRRRDHGPRLRPLLPRDRDRRGRDRRRADRGGASATSTWTTRTSTVHHEDARPWLRALRRRLRRDHGRRLPPALHPLLPGDQGVLRAGPRPAGAGRRGRSSTPATPRATTTSRRCSAGRWPRSSRPSSATRSRTRTRC